MDTGATLSLLSLDKWKDYCVANNRSPRLRSLPRGMALTSLSGDEIECHGTGEVFLLGKMVSFYICSNIGKHDMIVGDDMLRLMKATIKRDKDMVILNKRRFISQQLSIFDNRICSVTSNFDHWYDKYPDLFSVSGPLPCTSTVEMEIDTGDHPPFNMKPYRLPLSKRVLVDREIDQMLASGVITPSASPYSSPVVLIPKSDQTVRFCIDFRKINSQTVRDSYGLPNIQDIIDGLSGASWFSALDLKSAYWQVPMSKKSAPKTAFTCHKGTFQFNRMPFGLRNSPAVFQRFMNKIFAPFIGKFVFIYLDDVVCFSRTAEEHEVHLDQIFRVLREHNLTLKKEKCRLGLRELKLLGFIINGSGYRSDPSKVAAITNLLAPRNQHEVRSVLGLSNYYRAMIPKFAEITEPLTKLLHKGEKFEWGEGQQRAFEKLKQALASDHILAYPQVDREYQIYTDASMRSIGGLLTQKDDNNIERPIAYFSKALSPAQLTWSTIEKEGWALIYGLKKFECYLQGAKVTAYTDHKPLRSLFINENKNSKIQRWSILLAERGCEVKHTSGRLNVKADALSRLRTEPTPCLPGDPDHPTSGLLTDFQVGAVSMAQCINILTPDRPQKDWEPEDDADELGEEEWSDLSSEEIFAIEDQAQRDLEDIVMEGGDSEIPWDFDQLEVQAVREEQRTMKEYRLAEENMERYTLQDGLLYTLEAPPGQQEYPRLVVPPSCRFRVIRRAHTEVGHQGVKKTIDRLQECYKWPGQGRDVYNHIRKCGRCQINQKRPIHPPPTDMPVAQYPGHIIGMDFIGPMHRSNEGNLYCLTIMDHATGWVEVQPLPSKEAKHVLRYLHLNYFPRYGVPEICIHDNGRELKNNSVDPYLRSLGCEVRTTTPYSPSTNGKLERQHRTLKNTLRKLANTALGSWEACLGPALWAHRLSRSSVTGYSPFFLQYGRHPRCPKQKLLRRQLGSGPAILADRLDELSRAFKAAAQNTEESRKYNNKRRAGMVNCEPLKVGDHICILARQRGRLDPFRDHGYVVTRVRGSVIFAVGYGNKRVVVNRAHCLKVDSDINWEAEEVRIPLARNPQNLPRVLVRDEMAPQNPAQGPVHATLREDPDYVPRGLVHVVPNIRNTRSVTAAKRSLNDPQGPGPENGQILAKRPNLQRLIRDYDPVQQRQSPSLAHRPGSQIQTGKRPREEDGNEASTTNTRSKRMILRGEKRSSPELGTEIYPTPKRVLRSHTLREKRLAGESEETPYQKRIRVDPSLQADMQIAMIQFVALYFHPKSEGGPLGNRRGRLK